MVFVVWCLVFELRFVLFLRCVCVVFGVCCWCLCLVSGAWRLTFDMCVFGVWRLAFGLLFWRVAFGIWCLVFDVWCLLFGV